MTYVIVKISHLADCDSMHIYNENSTFLLSSLPRAPETIQEPPRAHREPPRATETFRKPPKRLKSSENPGTPPETSESTEELMRAPRAPESPRESPRASESCQPASRGGGGRAGARCTERVVRSIWNHRVLSPN